MSVFVCMGVCVRLGPDSDGKGIISQAGRKHSERRMLLSPKQFM